MDVLINSYIAGGSRWRRTHAGGKVRKRIVRQGEKEEDEEERDDYDYDDDCE